MTVSTADYVWGKVNVCAVTLGPRQRDIEDYEQCACDSRDRPSQGTQYQRYIGTVAKVHVRSSVCQSRTTHAILRVGYSCQAPWYKSRNLPELELHAKSRIRAETCRLAPCSVHHRRAPPTDLILLEIHLTKVLHPRLLPVTLVVRPNERCPGSPCQRRPGIHAPLTSQLRS